MLVRTHRLAHAFRLAVLAILVAGVVAFFMARGARHEASTTVPFEATAASSLPVVDTRTTLAPPEPVAADARQTVPASNAPAPARDARLTQVLVRVVDTDESPWGGLVETPHVNRYARIRPTTAALYAVVARSAAHERMPLEDLFVPLNRVGPGEYTFDAIVGRSYMTVLQGNDVVFTAQDVTARDADARAQVSLVAHTRFERGTLSVRPRNAWGKSVVSQIRVRLEEARTGFPFLDESDSERDPSWITRFVPPGTYTLIVEGEPFLDWIHGTVLGARTYGGSVTTVDVRAGETTWVEPVMGEGARVHVAITGRHGAQDRDALTKLHPTMTVGDLDAWASLVEIQLLAPSRWPVPVRFRDDGPFPDSEGPNLRSELPFGAEQTSELLTSGTYTLQARTRGGRVATAPVVLVDGQTTSVRLEIPAK